MQILSKITMKAIVGDIKATLGDAAQIDLVKVYGVCTGSFVKPTTYGDSVGLKGEFKALNVATNEEFIAGVAYLPKSLTDLIANQISDEVTKVQFAFIVGAKAAPKSSVGYEFTVKPLLKVEKNDTLALIENQMKDAK